MIKIEIKFHPKFLSLHLLSNAPLLLNYFSSAKTKNKRKVKADKIIKGTQLKFIIKGNWPESVCPLCKSRDFSRFTKRDEKSLQKKKAVKTNSCYIGTLKKLLLR